MNALVGAKVSIVSSKPQTTRQRVLGLALLAPRPDMAPTTQAVLVDTAGVMSVESDGFESFEKRKKKVLMTKLLRSMVKTAWKSTRDADAIIWVLDAWKCSRYGDFLPPAASLDGFDITAPVSDPWWRSPQLEAEVGILRKLRKKQQKVTVVLNKIDLLEYYGVDVVETVATVREQLNLSLGTNENGEALLENLFPTSVAKDPASLGMLKKWLCETLPRQSPIFPLDVICDMPLRVIASEMTREKLFFELRHNLPYACAVVTKVWEETPEGGLVIGQQVVVKATSASRILQGVLKKITPELEGKVSKAVNDGRPVELHFNVKAGDF